MNKERVRSATWRDELEIFFCYLSFFGLPEKADAIICFPGEKETRRIDYAYFLHKKYLEVNEKTYLLIAGGGDKDPVIEERKSDLIFYQGKTHPGPG